MLSTEWRVCNPLYFTPELITILLNSPAYLKKTVVAVFCNKSIMPCALLNYTDNSDTYLCSSFKMRPGFTNIIRTRV